MKYIKLLNNSVLHYGIIVSIRLKTKARQKQRNAHKGNGYGAKLSILNLLMPLAKRNMSLIWSLLQSVVMLLMLPITQTPKCFKRLRKKAKCLAS